MVLLPQLEAKQTCPAGAVTSESEPRTAFLAAATYDRDAVGEAFSSIERLTKANVDLERQVAPLNAALESGGFKAWIARRMMGV